MSFHCTCSLSPLALRMVSTKKCVCLVNQSVAHFEQFIAEHSAWTCLCHLLRSGGRRAHCCVRCGDPNPGFGSPQFPTARKLPCDDHRIIMISVESARVSIVGGHDYVRLLLTCVTLHKSALDSKHARPPPNSVVAERVVPRPDPSLSYFYPLDPACASFAYCIHVQKLP